MKAGVAIILALLIVGGAGCAFWERIAVIAAPKKKATASRSKAASKADELFWKTFHNGEYDKIQDALEVLTAAYLRTPNDAKTAAHIAWLHNWRIAERARMNSPPAAITDDTILARRYFQEAVKLDPSDARYLGFLAGHTLAEGFLHKDERLSREGYFMMLDAIKAWPEFRLSRTYAAWRYRSVLEDRINRAQTNVALLNADGDTPKVRMMINSEFSCTACHQH